MEPGQKEKIKGFEDNKKKSIMVAQDTKKKKGWGKMYRRRLSHAFLK